MDHKPSIKAVVARKRRETISAYWLAGYDAYEAGLNIHGIGITADELVEIAKVFLANEHAAWAKAIEPRGEQYDRGHRP